LTPVHCHVWYCDLGHFHASARYDGCAPISSFVKAYEPCRDDHGHFAPCPGGPQQYQPHPRQGGQGQGGTQGQPRVGTGIPGKPAGKPAAQAQQAKVDRMTQARSLIEQIKVKPELAKDRAHMVNVANHLASLTVRELREVNKDYGLKAQHKDKAEFQNRVREKLEAFYKGQAGTTARKPEEKPREEPKNAPKETAKPETKPKEEKPKAEKPPSKAQVQAEAKEKANDLVKQMLADPAKTGQDKDKHQELLGHLSKLTKDQLREVFNAHNVHAHVVGNRARIDKNVAQALKSQISWRLGSINPKTGKPYGDELAGPGKTEAKPEVKPEAKPEPKKPEAKPQEPEWKQLAASVTLAKPEGRADTLKRMEKLSPGDAQQVWLENSWAAGAIPHQDVTDGKSLVQAVQKLQQYRDWRADKHDPKKETVDAYVGRHLPGLDNLAGRMDVKDVDHPAVKDHLFHLSQLPEPVLSSLADAGVKLFVGNKTVPDLNGNRDLKGVQPRGWAAGQTWDVVPGSYNPDNRGINAGVGVHGTASLVLHETGHAIGHLLKYDYSDKLHSFHAQLYDKLTPYERQGGPGGAAGKQEFLAESVGRYIMYGHAEAAKRYSPEYADWVKNDVLSGKNARERPGNL
jgi:hypothetical protein